VTAAEVKFFCKHASTLRVCRWRTLAEEAAWVWAAKHIARHVILHIIDPSLLSQMASHDVASMICVCWVWPGKCIARHVILHIMGPGFLSQMTSHDVASKICVALCTGGGRRVGADAAVGQRGHAVVRHAVHPHARRGCLRGQVRVRGFTDHCHVNHRSCHVHVIHQD